MTVVLADDGDDDVCVSVCVSVGVCLCVSVCVSVCLCVCLLAVKSAHLEAANESGRSRRSKSSSLSWLLSHSQLPQRSRKPLTAEQLEQRQARV